MLRVCIGRWWRRSDWRWRSAAAGRKASIRTSFRFGATLPAGGSVSEFESALDAELARVVRDGVTERELRRAKNMAAADFWRGVSTIDGKARLLGEYAVMHGDYRLLFAAPGAYERVTREDVAQIARRSSIPSGAPSACSQTDGKSDECWGGARSMNGAVHHDSAASARLANGVKLILMPRHDVPLIAFEAVVRGGARLDQPRARRGGIADRGAADAAAPATAMPTRLPMRSRTRRQFRCRRPQRGDAGAWPVPGARSRSCCWACWPMHCSARASTLDELNTLRSRRIEFIKAAKDSEPQSLIGSLRPRAAVSREHAYGKPIGGSETSLAAISCTQDLLQFYQRPFRCRSPDAGVRRRFRSGMRSSDAVDEPPFGSWRACRRAAWSALAPRSACAAGGCLLIDAPEFGADLFLDRQCRGRALVCAARGARTHQHRLWRQLRLDADAGAARPVGPDLFGARPVFIAARARRVCHQLLHPDRQHTRGDRGCTADAVDPETAGRRRCDHRFRTQLYPGPVCRSDLRPVADWASSAGGS